MKLKQYSFLVLLMIAAFSMMSNKGGRGFQFNVGLTNAPGESGATCGSAGCHNGGSFGTGMDLFLTDMDGNVADEYEPGTEYNLHLNITSSQGNPIRYGFQMIALDDANAPINNWGEVNVPYRKYPLGEREYVEQTQSLLDSNIVLSWTAPEEGTGAVNFYATVNNCNGNGVFTGDQAFSGSVAIMESQVSSALDITDKVLRISPNPVSEIININTELDDFSIKVFSLTGAVMRDISLVNDQLSVSQLTSGIYVIVATDSNGHIVHSERFVKI